MFDVHDFPRGTPLPPVEAADLSAVLKIAIIRNLSDPLLDRSLHLVEAALHLVLRAGFHISPWPS
jgi:hypothetical protein